MITGRINAQQEAVIELGLLLSDLTPRAVEAVIDTGYNGSLTLPRDLIDTLTLKFAGNRSALLADGSTVVLDMYLATVRWHELEREVIVAEAEGMALIGMSMLQGNRLTMDVLEDGTVTIEELVS